MKVLITGSGGVIGTVLSAGLKAEITGYDLPKQDITNFAQLNGSLKQQDAVVHLAWAKRHDNWLTERFDPNNLQGAHNVYEAAHLNGVKRVIMASSVHADDFVNSTKPGLRKPNTIPVPDSPYGASKCMIEALGRYYANAKGLEVVCIRFGGVNKDDVPPKTPVSERQVWLSQADCTSLVQTCLDAPSIKNNFAVIYGISDNKNMLHDTSNQFGWQPKDGTAKTEAK